jgi:hypothetical protein
LRDLSRGADEEMRQRIREVLDGAGAIDAAEEGTRRSMPWRRALACEILGQIGAERSVPVLIDRLGDDRAEVRMAAARALGAIGSPQAEPALASAFLERTKVPTGVAYDALGGRGPSGAEAFSRGLKRSDPSVRVASCFGMAALAGEADGDGAVATLTRVMESDDNVRVRTAATHALGVIGGTTPPAARSVLGACVHETASGTKTTRAAETAADGHPGRSSFEEASFRSCGRAGMTRLIGWGLLEIL